MDTRKISAQYWGMGGRRCPFCAGPKVTKTGGLKRKGYTCTQGYSCPDCEGGWTLSFAVNGDLEQLQEPQVPEVDAAEFDPALAVSSGTIIQELLAEHDLTPESFTAKYDELLPYFLEMLAGRKPILPRIARDLQTEFSLPTTYWYRLEAFNVAMEKRLKDAAKAAKATAEAETQKEPV